MKTKCIDLGKEIKHRKLKPIEFTECLTINKAIQLDNQSPSNFRYIELISRFYSPGEFDIMFAYQRPNFRQSGILFLGHWNDGIVI
jgi:hypothetical protein